MNEIEYKLRVKEKIQDRIIQESKLANLRRMASASLLGAATGAAVSGAAAAAIGTDKFSIGKSMAKGAFSGALVSAKVQHDKNKAFADNYRVKELKAMLEKSIKDIQKIKDSDDSDKDERIKAKLKKVRDWNAELQQIMTKYNKSKNNK